MAHIRPKYVQFTLTSIHLTPICPALFNDSIQCLRTPKEHLQRANFPVVSNLNLKLDVGHWSVRHSHQLLAHSRASRFSVLTGWTPADMCCGCRMNCRGKVFVMNDLQLEHTSLKAGQHTPVLLQPKWANFPAHFVLVLASFNTFPRLPSKRKPLL